MSLSLNPYAPACFAPRDRLTWLHIMSETLESSEVDLNRNEQIIINRAHDFTHNGDEDEDDEVRKQKLDAYLCAHYNAHWSWIMKLSLSILREDFKTKKARMSCLSTLKDTIVNATTESGGIDFYALLSKLSPSVATEIKRPPAQKDACRFMFEIDYELYCLYRTPVGMKKEEEETEEIKVIRQPQCLNKKWARLQAKEKLERKVEAIHATWAASCQHEADPQHAIDKKTTSLLVMRLKDQDSNYWNPNTGFYDLDAKLLKLVMDDIKHGLPSHSGTKRVPATKKSEKKVPMKAEPVTEEEQEDEITLAALKDLTIANIGNMMTGESESIDRKRLEASVLSEISLPIPNAVIKRYSTFTKKLVKLIESKRDQLLKEEDRSSDDCDKVNEELLALLREDECDSAATAFANVSIEEDSVEREIVGEDGGVQADAPNEAQA